MSRAGRLWRAGLAAMAVVLLSIESGGPLLHPASVEFETTAEIPYTPFRFETTDGQAELFVAFLHDTNPAAFERMTKAILDGRPFADAVMESYGTHLHALWVRFRQRQDDWTGEVRRELVSPRP